MEGASPAPSRILIVRLGALGDIVRTLPAVRLLRRTWPAAEIAWAVESGPAALLEGAPDVDRLLVLERRALERDLRGARLAALAALRGYAASLRAFAPQLSLDFQASFKSGLVAYASGAPRRIGFGRADAREGAHIFATERVPLPRPRVHRVERAATLARAAGARDGELRADLGLSAAERADGARRVARLASGRRRAIALAPFSSPRQAWKRYPLERWASVAASLGEAGHAVLVLGGPGEEQETRALCSAAGAGVVPGGEGGPRELAATLAACALFVGGDTGPMHLAWAVGTPVVAIYGPTDPVLNAPFGDGHVVLAPESPSNRGASEGFPGITPTRIADAALERLQAARALDPRQNPDSLPKGAPDG
jgi:ADP-heptose:LPS heptosyltransferase